MKKDLLKHRFAPIIAFIASAALFLGQALVYIHQLPSTLDEGNYLYKGYLFVTGVMQPFQPYGVWTNKMPFAFLIPGAAQAIFEPGLLTGRYFAILLGLITLFALWWFVRREAGGWWAAAAVAVIAINPGVVRMYSQALSEGVVSCLLMTAVAIGVGRDRKLWQVIAAGIVLAITGLTRENMLPILGLYYIYLIFEHGWKKMFLAAIPGVFIIGLVHVIYWPDIVTNIWRQWLPDALKAYFPLFPDAIWKLDISFTSRLYSFWQGMRFHFAMLFGLVILVLLPPARTGWKDASAKRTILFLFSTVVLMTAAHAWAALWKDYCVFCFGLYLNFFSCLGVALIAIAMPQMRRTASPLINILAGIIILLFSTGIAFGAHQELDDSLMKISVPRISGMQLQPGSTELWRALSNKFGYTADQLSQYIPTAFGLMAGAFFILICLAVFRRVKKSFPAVSWGAFALLVFFALGLILSPTVVFGNPPEPDCGADVITSTQTAAAHIAALVPPGSTIFWEGGLSPAVLLNVPGVKIYGPQLNDGYSFREDSDSDKLFKYGFWNAELSARWINSADYLLIIDYAYKNKYNSVIDLDKYQELAISNPIATCRDYSQIHTFKRIK